MTPPSAGQSYNLTLGPILDNSSTAVETDYFPSTGHVEPGLLGLQPAGGPASTVYTVQNGPSQSIAVTAQQWSVINDVNSNGTPVAGGPFGRPTC